MRLSAAALLFLAGFGCDGRDPPRDPPREPPLPPKPPSPPLEHRVEGALERLANEAGIELADPPSPAGSLREEVERFTTLSACVSEHRPADSLLGDALDALGYDALTRDACRILQALSARDSSLCAPILASPLRARCEASVATLTGDPKRCPLDGSSRNPVCLARASRDPRLCAGASEREAKTCRALVLGDPKLCEKDASCMRQVARWSSLHEPAAHQDAFATKLLVEVRETKDEASPRVFDLGELAAKGAVVRKRAGKLELSLGSPRDASWLPADTKLATLRGHFWLKTGKASPETATLPLLPLSARFELLLPEVATLSSVTGRADGAFTVRKLVPEPGGAVQLDLEATVTEAGRGFRVRAEVETFVRDVVAD